MGLLNQRDEGSVLANAAEFVNQGNDANEFGQEKSV